MKAQLVLSVLFGTRDLDDALYPIYQPITSWFKSRVNTYSELFKEMK